jgi:CRISPR-associated protein Csb2
MWRLKKVLKTKARPDMAVILRQSFPLGRFHATRWNQNPFEDPYGEWPPSPWRLLRALAARWFQYSRETGNGNIDLRNRLLAKLAREVPSFWLPDTTWRGFPIRQYQPTGVGWSDAQKKNPGYKRPGTTLVQDHYRALPPAESVLWVWHENTELDRDETALLQELLKRILYFGRTESFCRFEPIQGGQAAVNCRLSAQAGSGNPVLVPVPGGDLNLEALFASTDGDCVAEGSGYQVRDLLKERRIPPGTAWYYATIPANKAPAPAAGPRWRHPLGLRALQFAVGGRVYPPAAHWVKLTERFRAAVIRQRCLQISRGATHRYWELASGQREALSLIRGLEAHGKRIQGEGTAFFALFPDAKGAPTRLISWRLSPFTDDEIDAYLAATEQPLAWEWGSADWRVRLVPLPFAVAGPEEYWARGAVWEATTPFVLPSGLQRFRRHGRVRKGETPDACLKKLLKKSGFPEANVELLQREPTWVTIHETLQERRLRERRTRMRPGYFFRLRFETAVQGPIAVGHSCHFGLGLFAVPTQP